MLIFLMPVTFVSAVIGIVIGAAVGRRFGGWVGAACLGMLLGLAPMVITLVGYIYCLDPPAPAPDPHAGYR